MPDTKVQKTMEKLRLRYEQLNTQRIQVETNRKNAQQQLAKLKKQAQQQFGTDDVGELRKKLQQMKKDNEKTRTAYEKDLDQIETKLAEIDENFKNDDSQIDDVT